MKKILGLSIAALLVIAMVAGGTFAYFNDTETSTDNTITAGTLNLVPAASGSITNGSFNAGTYAASVTPLGDGVDGYVTFAKVSPGNSGEVIWTLTNNGNLGGYLSVTMTRTADNDNGFTEPEDSVSGTYNDSNDGTADGDLDNYMSVAILADLNGDDTYETTIQASAVGGLVTILPTVDTPVTVINKSAMAAAGVIKLKLTWSIATDIVGVDDNIIQGDSVQLNLSFVLAQNNV
jgi:predicted ribosomally synthesized peptide with SipW-like signal peptide